MVVFLNAYWVQCLPACSSGMRPGSAWRSSPSSCFCSSLLHAWLWHLASKLGGIGADVTLQRPGLRCTRILIGVTLDSPQLLDTLCLPAAEPFRFNPFWNLSVQIWLGATSTWSWKHSCRTFWTELCRSCSKVAVGCPRPVGGVRSWRWL